MPEVLLLSVVSSLAVWVQFRVLTELKALESINRTTVLILNEVRGIKHV